MTERPILFSAPMVLALLRAESPKTQTRRTCSSARWWRHVDFVAGRGDSENDPSNWGYADEYGDYWTLAKGPGSGALPCPYGVPGDRMWVRETHILDPPIDGTWPSVGDTYAAVDDIPGRYRTPKHVLYRATIQADKAWATEYVERWRWRPSIFMPRWASRITLEITDVRVQRVQEISPEDALAEGVTGDSLADHAGEYWREEAVALYRDLWDQINGKRAPWASNPWVWAVTFRRLA